jgi:hypothetical protein
MMKNTILNIANIVNIMNPVRSEIYLEAGLVPWTPMMLFVLVDIVHCSKSWTSIHTDSMVHYADP